ncbi:antibiotic biosynthesis monooxygenase family protein [Streptomyces kebangsaanensis]|uniref:antibiotic biosynthesis monooxygenase family protein n=1 Tax=Streptomyces kebangsaanensis TaxID=864058 RepID=UPI00093F0B38|nr:antibiotic biosynthesis monooxygenase [Streptomyces kebangsaanensis]
MSVVKINVLTVPAEQRETLEKRFASRAHAVENSDGFEWFELLRPLEGTDTYLVYTRWRDEESFQAWMEGPMKAAHHGAGAGGGESGAEGGAEGGERPRPAATGSTLWSFEVVQQAGPGAESGA